VLHWPTTGRIQWSAAAATNMAVRARRLQEADAVIGTDSELQVLQDFPDIVRSPAIPARSPRDPGALSRPSSSPTCARSCACQNPDEAIKWARANTGGSTRSTRAREKGVWLPGLVSNQRLS